MVTVAGLALGVTSVIWTVVWSGWVCLSVSGAVSTLSSTGALVAIMSFRSTGGVRVSGGVVTVSRNATAALSW